MPGDNSTCKLSIIGATTDQTVIDNFITCEIGKYGPKSAAYVDAVMAHAQAMAQQLLATAQTDVTADIDKVENFLSSFIQRTMTALDEDVDKLKTTANQIFAQALKALDAWVDHEIDHLVHSFTPYLAWLVSLLLVFHFLNMFESLPVAYRLLIALLVVMSVSPRIRVPADKVAIPTAVVLLALAVVKKE